MSDKSINSKIPGKQKGIEVVIIIMVLIALICGWFLKNSIESKKIEFAGDLFVFNYPAKWLCQKGITDSSSVSGFQSMSGGQDELVLFKAGDIQSESLYKTEFLIKSLKYSFENTDRAGQDPSLYIFNKQAQVYGNSLNNFRFISSENAEIDGKKGYRMEYTFVSEPMSALFRDALPVVCYGVDFLLFNENTIYIISMTFDADDKEEEIGILDSIIGNIKFSNKGGV